MDSPRQSGEYLPRVVRRIDWLHLDISEKRCDACGEWAEVHTWGILSASGDRVIYCSESPVMRPTQQVSYQVGQTGTVYV